MLERPRKATTSGGMKWVKQMRGDENLRHAHTQALKEVENKKATGEDRHHLPGEG